MIVGHIGAAFAARWRWPSLPLPWLLGATMAPDLLRLALRSTGSHWRLANYYSHVLPWGALWAVLLAATAWAVLRRPTAALVIGALVLSHLALDALSGRKPVWTNGPPGLGLEEYQQAEFVVEAALAWAGWHLLRRRRVPRWATGRRALAILLVGQAAYLVETFRDRPYATRCVEYPVRPCWIRRRDHPPAGLEPDRSRTSSPSTPPHVEPDSSR
jgi:hypothetical protein